jgi:hypothetical protein
MSKWQGERKKIRAYTVHHAKLALNQSSYVGYYGYPVVVADKQMHDAMDSLQGAWGLWMLG